MFYKIILTDYDEKESLHYSTEEPWMEHGALITRHNDVINYWPVMNYSHIQVEYSDTGWDVVSGFKRKMDEV